MNEREFPVKVKVEYRRQPKKLPAGEFSSWLRITRRAQRLRLVGADVPCGECTACCRASLFIHVGPDETRTLERIPRSLLFPAPGRPAGHMVMGYNERGECPMLIDGRCSIYEDRPLTCRKYDCRLFAATGIMPKEPTALEIAARARRWKFRFGSARSQSQYTALRATADYLRKNAKRFPSGIVPANPTQLAALAIKAFKGLHSPQSEPHGRGSRLRSRRADRVRAILRALESFESGS